MRRTLFDERPDERPTPATATPAARPGAPVPRPYQRAAVWGGDGHPGILPALAEHRRTLVDVATGLGKTVIMGQVADRHLTTADTGVMLLAHREELIFQAAAELEPIIGFRPEVEMGGYVADPKARCVVGSVQTLFGERRLSRFDPARFGLVMVDECHHSIKSNATYAKPLDRFKDSLLLGVTATARRAAGRGGQAAALGHTFGSLAYRMGIREGVEGGWLVPVSQMTVRVDSLDISEVGTRAGELDQGQLGAAMTADDRTTAEIAAAVVEHCGTAPTLVFTCPRPKGEPVGQGERLARLLNSLRPGSAVFLSGQTPPDDRRRQLRRFEGCEYPYLIGCSLFTEGFNCPQIANVVMARPTKSIVYYTQAIGRGTRTLRGVLAPHLNERPAGDRRAAIAASGKPGLTVYDFAGNAGSHKLITAVDIFAGPESEACRAAVREKAAGGPVDVLALLEREERGEREAAERRLVARVSTTLTPVSPFAHSDAGAGRAAAKRTMTDPASPDQRAFIEQNGGVWPKGGMTAGEAGACIADIARRRRAKACSQKQQRTLANLGLPDREWPKAHAKALLDWADAKGWPWGRLSRPVRAMLGIKEVVGGAGVTPGYRLTVEGRAVGGTYATPGEVRRAYEGLAAEPGRSN